MFSKLQSLWAGYPWACVSVTENLNAANQCEIGVSVIFDFVVEAIVATEAKPIAVPICVFEEIVEGVRSVQFSLDENVFAEVVNQSAISYTSVHDEP